MEQLRCAKQIFLATAFARTSGWNLIESAMLESEASISIVTGLYFCHTEPDLLRRWLRLMPKHPRLRVSLAASTKIPKIGNPVFHPKVLIVCGDSGRFAIVGSGNLTSGGLRSNTECSIYTDDPASIDGLLHWFRGIEAVLLDEKAVLIYEPRYDQSLAAQKTIEEAQREAEQDIKQEITFHRRAEAIRTAQAYFESAEFVEKKRKRSGAIPKIRNLLDFYAFNFDANAWTEFYKMRSLGKIREAYLTSTVENLARIQEALRYLFEEGQAIEDRLPQLLERKGDYHVRGVGPNLVEKFLVAHDPKMWFIRNKKVATILTNFGYEYSGKGGATASYLVFVKAMRSFKDDCGAEDGVELDAFFSDLYDKQKQAKTSQNRTKGE